MRSVHFPPTFEGWRQEARALLSARVDPSLVVWQPAGLGQGDLFSSAAVEQKPLQASSSLTLPASFLRLAESVAMIRSGEQWPLLYRMAYRLLHESPHLLNVSIDPDVAALHLLKKAISRDIHKMHAFVRFKLEEKNGIYAAWYEPDHKILRAGATFFERRFGDKPWAIFTPDESALWDGSKLRFGPGLEREKFSLEDPFDLIWTEYYRSTFNPARINLKAMHAEMPQKFWHNLPEAMVIRELVRTAPSRVQEMAAKPHYLAKPPAGASLTELKTAAKSCESCPLFAKATQTVFGEGDPRAALMIVGEQPGDEEDLSGKPFVGPAGGILAQALAAAKISRSEIYLTNAVKHYKWEPSNRPSKPRLHKTASAMEISACRPWLEAEIEKVKPRIILALGRSAGLSLLGRIPNLQRERGKILQSPSGEAVLLSWHPAAILRSMSEAERASRLLELTLDLKLAQEFCETIG